MSAMSWWKPCVAGLVVGALLRCIVDTDTESEPRSCVDDKSCRSGELCALGDSGVGTCLMPHDGVGTSCTLPKTEEFRRACNPAPRDPNRDAGLNEVQRESKASCAVKNFAGCETRVCLVYRGSSPFCSETCATDDDCASQLCRPLLGDPNLSDPNICERTECYCVRRGDLDEPATQ